MASDLMDTDAGHDLLVAVDEDDAPLIVKAHERQNVVELHRVPEGGLMQVPAGVEAHLSILHVEGGMWKERITAHMVIMEMAQDDVLDAGTVNTKHGQALGWTAQELAPTPGADGF